MDWVAALCATWLESSCHAAIHVNDCAVRPVAKGQCAAERSGEPVECGGQAKNRNAEYGNHPACDAENGSKERIRWHWHPITSQELILHELQKKIQNCVVWMLNMFFEGHTGAT